jgi:hypothetical protein
MKKSILAFCSLFTVLAACNKNITELPPATQTGAHTFGAKIDGALWGPKGFGPTGGANLLEARFLPGPSVMVTARNLASSPNESEMEIYIKNVTAPGVYQLNTDVTLPTQAASYAYFVKRTITPTNEWITSSQYTGTVNITRIDTAARIMSGTFQFQASNPGYSPFQVINVTEGRFDVNVN